MSARPRHPSVRSHRSPRRLLEVVALGAVAAFGFGLSVPSDGAFAATTHHASSHTPTPFERSLEGKTLQADIESGRISEQDVLDAGAHGLTLNGTRIDGWTEPTAAQRAAGAKVADQLRADPAMAASARAAVGDAAAAGDLDDLELGDAPPAADPSDAAAVAASAHWWNKVAKWLKGSHIYINPQWFRTIITGGVTAGMVGLCMFFDFSKTTCSLVGAAVGAISEFIKNTKCGRNGVWLYYPWWWKSHC